MVSWLILVSRRERQLLHTLFSTLQTDISAALDEQTNRHHARDVIDLRRFQLHRIDDLQACQIAGHAAVVDPPAACRPSCAGASHHPMSSACATAG